MHDWPPKREGGLIGDIELQGLHSPSKYIDITNFPFSSKMGNRGKKTQLTQFTILYIVEPSSNMVQYKIILMMKDIGGEGGGSV